MLRTLFMLIALLGTLPVMANIAVIVHPSNNATINADEVVRIYTGRINTFQAVNLAENVALRAEFDQKGVGRSSAQLKAHWSKLVFTGKGTPPTELASEQEVLNFVASNPQAIGYINAANVTDAVKVVHTIN